MSLDAGMQWVASGSSALLVVPSVIIPREHNVLINPKHPDAVAIVFTKLPDRIVFDARLRPKPSTSV